MDGSCESGFCLANPLKAKFKKNGTSSKSGHRNTYGHTWLFREILGHTNQAGNISKGQAKACEKA
jgi:hypothetical protein